MRRLFFILLVLTACAPKELHFTFWDQGLPKTGEWRTNLAVGDVNNDGLLDIAGIERKGNGNASIWLNPGNGSWQRSTKGIHEKSQCGVGVAFYDVNNDGNLDAAFAQHCGGPAVYLGDGTGTWTNYSTGLLTKDVNAIALADFDDDGLKDIVTLGAFTDGFIAYKNAGEWLQQNTSLPEKIHATPYVILTPDLNNDEMPDIVSTGGKIYVYLNKGNFKFEPADKGLENIALYTFLAVADVNNDGLQDIAANGPGLFIYEQQKDNSWKLLYNFTAACQTGGGVSLEDINNDKQPDLTAFCNNGIKTFFGPDFSEIKNNIPPPTASQYGLIVADINNDGKKDIISASEGIQVWLQT